MPKNKPLADSNPESIEQAWAQRDELAVAVAVASKYARVLDMTDSGRDIKPLATGLFEAIDRVKAIESARQLGEDTPLAGILAEAEGVLANA